MVAENYSNAYKEVIEVLKYAKREDVNKIPKNEILLYKNNMNKNHNFFVDSNKTLEEQKLSKEAKAVLGNIFKKYWATDYEIQRIEAKEKYDMEQAEKAKYEKYNPNDIFKNREKDILKEENMSNTLAIVEYKESLLERILNKIKSIFNR